MADSFHLIGGGAIAHFSADRPITSLSEDLLGRAAFARAVADSIRSWKGKECLVMALCGPWGSGKSSVKNMVLESLRDNREDCPLILEFNPWQITGQDRLTEAFFEEIGVCLGRDDTPDESVGRAAKWKEYGALLSLGSSATASLKTLLTLIGVPGAPLLEPAVIALKKGASALETGAAGLEAGAVVRSRSLSQLKSELAGELQELERPVLIVMDDIDRLAKDEIKLLLRLVKANADFPNLVYLLLFQRDVVEKSLEDVSPVSGKDFLEKIVQVGFDLPAIRSAELQKALETRLDSILGDVHSKRRLDQHRWSNLYYSGLRRYFRTIRDVNRFCSTLAFHAALFRHEKNFEANPVDLIALEILRVFEPEVYSRLRAAKGLLTRCVSLEWMPSIDPEVNKRELESIVDAASPENRARVRRIVGELFPASAQTFGEHPDRLDEAKAYRDLRVCHPDVFDRYFHFALGPRDISQGEIDEILSNLSNRRELVEAFCRMKARGLIDEALEALSNHQDEIDLANAVSVLSALLEIAEGLPAGLTSEFSLDSGRLALAIARGLLMRIEDATRRFELFKLTLEESESLSLPCLMVAWEDGGWRSRKSGPHVFEEAKVPELGSLCVGKIRKAAEAGTLHRKPGLQIILGIWQRWGDATELKLWAESTATSLAGGVALVHAFLHETRYANARDYVSRIRRSVDLKSLEQYVPLGILQKTLAGDIRESLNEAQSDAILAFSEAMAARQTSGTEQVQGLS